MNDAWHVQTLIALAGVALVGIGMIATFLVAIFKAGVKANAVIAGMDRLDASFRSFKMDVKDEFSKVRKRQDDQSRVLADQSRALEEHSRRLVQIESNGRSR